MSEIVRNRYIEIWEKKKKALFFFSKTRIFLRKKEKRAARFDSNEHENHEFPDIFSNLFRRKIKIGDYTWFRKRGEDSSGWEKSRNARSIERQLERTVKEPLAASLKSRDYSDLLYRVNCGIKFARWERKRDERKDVYIYQMRIKWEQRKRIKHETRGREG